MKKNRFKQFDGTGTLTIFDIDETLFHTKATVKVVKGGKVVRVLSNQQFNTYVKQDDEQFDFGEFESAENFKNTSVPVVRMVEKAKRIVKAKGNPHSRAIICTARGDFDDKEMFLQTFRDHGIDIDRMHVERAGNLDVGSSAVAKKIIIRKYLETRNYTRVRFYDDAMSNLTAFLDLQSEFPRIRFEAYYVDHKGNDQRIV